MEKCKKCKKPLKPWDRVCGKCGKVVKIPMLPKLTIKILIIGASAEIDVEAFVKEFYNIKKHSYLTINLLLRKLPSSSRIKIKYSPEARLVNCNSIVLLLLIYDSFSIILPKRS